MKQKFMILITLFLISYSLQPFANEEKENIYLIQIINQIEAIKPLIISAEKEQPKNLRIQFHYTSYHDSSGKLHNGLLEDFHEIKIGIQDKLKQSMLEPHRITAITGDYVDKDK